MAQFLKQNSDLKGLLNFDTGAYTNDAVVFVGTVASATTVTVSGITNSLAIPAAATCVVARGPGVAAGATFVSYATGTLTLSAGALAGLTVGSSVSIVVKTLATLGATIQPQGPKLQFFTVGATGVANFADTVVQVVQQRATVHLYRVVDADNIAFATYSTEAWDTANGATTDNSLDAAVSAATGLTVTMTQTATFN